MALQFSNLVPELPKKLNNRTESLALIEQLPLRQLLSLNAYPDKGGGRLYAPLLLRYINSTEERGCVPHKHRIANFKLTLSRAPQRHARRFAINGG